MPLAHAIHPHPLCAAQLAIVVLVGALFFFIAMCIDASVADDIGNGANDEKDKYVAGAIFDFFAAAGFGVAGALTLLNKDGTETPQ